jgi:protease-4
MADSVVDHNAMDSATVTNEQAPRPQPPAVPQQPRGQGRGCLWALTVSVLAPIFVFIVTLCLLIFGLPAMVNMTPSGNAGIDDKPPVTEIWSCGQGEVKVVRIPIHGTLIENHDYGPFSSPGPVSVALMQIRAATVDENVRAIIVEIDSPGGGVTASDLIYNALMDFKKTDSNRVVVAVLGDTAASGGYYVAAAADHIIAHPTTMTGSIGVIMAKIDLKGLGEKYGVGLDVIKAGSKKDMLNPFEEMTEEERAILQVMVDEMHTRFIELVAESRDELTVEEVRALADGRVFTGAKALELKLVDEIGYWDGAVDATCSLLGVKDVKIVKYQEEFSLGALFAAEAPDTPSLSASTLMDLARTRVMYLWQM